MALTRVQAETILVRRLGPGLSRAAMSIAVDGTNPDMADPIAWALSELGYTPATDITSPSDTDLTQIAAADVNRYLAVCEWRMVKNIIGNLNHTDERMGPMGQWNSQYAKQLERYLENLEMRLERDYGWGLSQLSTGTVRVVTVEE